MTAVEQREYIAFLEVQLRLSDIELTESREALASKVDCAEAYADMRVREADEKTKAHAKQRDCYRADSDRSRRMFIGAAIMAALEMAVIVFQWVSRS